MTIEIYKTFKKNESNGIWYTSNKNQFSSEKYVLWSNFFCAWSVWLYLMHLANHSQNNLRFIYQYLSQMFDEISRTKLKKRTRCTYAQHSMYQFGCGISKMVGLKILRPTIFEIPQPNWYILCCAYVHRVRFFNFVREISSNIWLRYWYINLRLFWLWFAKCIKYSQTDHAQKKLDHKTYFSEENWFLLEVYHIPFDSFFLKVLYISMVTILLKMA